MQQQASLEMFTHVLVPIDTPENDRKRKFDELYDIVLKIPTYGIVTNGHEWQFLKLQRFHRSDGHFITNIRQSSLHYLQLKPENDQASMQAQFNQLQELLFVISGVLKLQISAVYNNQQFQSVKRAVRDDVIESLSAKFCHNIESNELSNDDENDVESIA